MADQAIQKYTGDTITEEQFNELVLTMNVGILTTTQRASFLWHYAKSLGLDPKTRPFDLIPGDKGKLIIYANRAASDQLRKIHKLSIENLYSGSLRLGKDKTGQDLVDESIYSVEVRVKDPTGRSEDHIGCVPIDNTTGEGRSNAIMRCSTKASRRATIAFCGLGMLDEMEVASVPHLAKAAGMVDQESKPDAPPTPKFVKPLPAAAPPAKV